MWRCAGARNAGLGTTTRDSVWGVRLWRRGRRWRPCWRRSCSNDDARASAPDPLPRALAALPRGVRRGRIRVRADTGYFDGKLARIAFLEGVEFAIGAKRIAPLWRLLSGLAAQDWAAARGLDGAGGAGALSRPGG